MVERWYPYAQPTDFPTQNDTISVFFTFRSRDEHFYRQDRVPQSGNQLAWRAERSIQFNLYGRTRPICSELCDFLELQVPAVAQRLYDLWRVRLGPIQADGTMEKNPQTSWFWTWYRYHISLPLAVTVT